MEPSEQPCSEGLSTPNPRVGGLAITTTTSLFSYPPSTDFTMVDRRGTLAQPLQLDTFSLTSGQLPTTQGGNGPIPEIAQPLPGSFPRWKQYLARNLLTRRFRRYPISDDTREDQDAKLWITSDTQIKFKPTKEKAKLELIFKHLGTHSLQQLHRMTFPSEGNNTFHFPSFIHENPKLEC